LINVGLPERNIVLKVYQVMLVQQVIHLWITPFNDVIPYLVI
jgi:hypothetical protein